MLVETSVASCMCTLNLHSRINIHCYTFLFLQYDDDLDCPIAASENFKGGENELELEHDNFESI